MSYEDDQDDIVESAREIESLRIEHKTLTARVAELEGELGILENERTGIVQRNDALQDRAKKAERENESLRGRWRRRTG